MLIKVGDLVMNKHGDLGMVTGVVKHPAIAGYDSGYIEWYPYSPKAGKINYSIEKIKEFRSNFEFYQELEKRGGHL